MRQGTLAAPEPMARCLAPPGDRDHAPTRVKLAKRVGGWITAALSPAPEHVVTPVERTSVKEPSTESLGVTHDVTSCFRGRGQCIIPKLNRKMLFFMPQISIFRLRRSAAGCSTESVFLYHARVNRLRIQHFSVHSILLVRQTVELRKWRGCSPALRKWRGCPSPRLRKWRVCPSWRLRK